MCRKTNWQIRSNWLHCLECQSSNRNKKAQLSTYIQSAFVSIKGFRFKRVNQQHFDETKVRPKEWLQAAVPGEFLQNHRLISKIFKRLQRVFFRFSSFWLYSSEWVLTFCKMRNQSFAEVFYLSKRRQKTEELKHTTRVQVSLFYGHQHLLGVTIE